VIVEGQAWIPEGDGDLGPAFVTVERTDGDEIAIEVYPRYGRERATTTIYLDRAACGFVAAALLSEAAGAS
jgi:hypothetical protein